MTANRLADYEIEFAVARSHWVALTYASIGSIARCLWAVPRLFLILELDDPSVA